MGRTIGFRDLAVTVETVRLEDDGFLLTWSVAPTPTIPGTVTDPDTGDVRTERFVQLRLTWRVRDNTGRRYANAAAGQDGDGGAWRVVERFAPAPPATARTLVMTLHETIGDEEALGPEIQTLRVRLAH